MSKSHDSLSGDGWGVEFEGPVRLVFVHLWRHVVGRRVVFTSDCHVVGAGTSAEVVAVTLYPEGPFVEGSWECAEDSEFGGFEVPLEDFLRSTRPCGEPRVSSP